MTIINIRKGEQHALIHGEFQEAMESVKKNQVDMIEIKKIKYEK